MTGRATGSLAPLRHRGFRLLVGGQLASNVGDAFYMVALPWYVLADHGGALLLGTVLAAYGVPRTVLLAVGGQASDRWRPWTVMMVSDSVRVVAAAGLAAAAAAGPARAVILVPIAVVLGAGALLGALASAHFGRLRRPAIAGSLAFLVEAVCMAAVPYLGGLPGAGAALVVLGLMNAFANVVMITAFQRWAPPDLLGRLMGLMMLSSFGIYPVSVAAGAFVVHGLGPAPFFPLAGATLAVAILAGLSQPAWRNFGMTADTNSGDPAPSVNVDEDSAAIHPDTARYAS